MDNQKKELENSIEKDKTKEDKSKTDAKEAISSIIIFVVLILIIASGFASGCVRCTACGADDTRFYLCASGTSPTGVEYKSCVGPAGCLGFGINSKCWPTECESIKKNSSSGNTLSGCVIYYNEAGCIAKSDVKSEGQYTDTITCLGIGCMGKKYVERTAETTQAKEQNNCLGIGCGGKAVVESRDYNSMMPRQFEKGCWGNE